MKVAIVTPTIGQEYLSQCIDSVQEQEYKNIVHYIFVDGKQCVNDKFNEKLYKAKEGDIQTNTVILEENVGKGWYGHRVYAACSFLVNADAICYLDEDNWISPDHVKRLVEKLQNGNQWAYSLRKIYNQEGKYVCEDNCESLGRWPVYFNDKVHHIDTSSYIVKRDVAITIGHAWYGQWGADRQFFANLRQNFPQYDCTNKHTLCYRLDNNTGKGESNPNSVDKDFFIKGNKIQKEKYDTIHFPWKKETKTVARVAPGISIIE